MPRWIIVGGGTAGCVVAARLSERADAEVTLIERGPDHGPEPAPGDVGPYLADPTRFATERVLRRPDRARELYVQGSGLGGSSLVNGSLVVSGDGSGNHLLPTELPWSLGAVGSALLASDDAAAPVVLARRDGHRVTAADAYLRPVTNRPNLHVRTGERVATLRFDGRRATGVELESGEFVPGDRVVVCCGAIRTPAVLLRSGVDTPGVGSGLQDHPSVTITLQLRPSAVDASTPTIAVAAAHGDHQVLALNHLPAFPKLGALVIGLLQVTSVGSVTIDTSGEPVVQLGQLATDADRTRLVDAAERTIGLLDHPAWADVVETAMIDDRGTSVASVTGDRPALERWVVERHGGHHHVAGTCREGEVTDAGRVRGYEGLFVGDASVFPGVPALNPYLSLIELTERLVAGWS